MPAFMAALRGRPGMAGLALRFAILTAARTGEVRGMRWGEVDLEAATWMVPAERMKAGSMHRVPLSEAALAVLAEVRAGNARPEALVFPGVRSGAPLSDMALAMLVRGMATDGLADGEPPRWRSLDGRVVVPHGFRSSFRDLGRVVQPPGRRGQGAGPPAGGLTAAGAPTGANGTTGIGSPSARPGPTPVVAGSHHAPAAAGGSQR